MPREAVSLTIADLSAFARRLRADLMQAPEFPGHLRLMNMLARSAGWANYQHLIARTAPEVTVPASMPGRTLSIALRNFDQAGRMVRWPAKTSIQGLCLWAIWSRLPPRRSVNEAEVNRVIDTWHGFGDRALVRRSLIDHRLCSRTQDGREYRRAELPPPTEALALLKALSERRGEAK